MIIRITSLFAAGCFAAAVKAAPGDLESGFFTQVTGSVYTTAIQPDGKLIIGGVFTAVNGGARLNIARLNTDGTLSSTIPYTYMENDVLSTAVQTDGKVIAGGGIRVLDGRPTIGFARLNADGTRDDTFNGPNTSNVFTTWIQRDGKIVIGGDFRSTPRPPYMLRLTGTAQVDATFAPNVNGTNAILRCMAVQGDGKIVIGGTFTSVGGATRNRLARIGPDGTLDTTFNPNPNTQFNPAVNALAVQADGKIFVVGNFSTIGGGTREKLARLLTDGRLDTTFAPTFALTGDAFSVGSVVIQTDGKILVSGQFDTVNGLARAGVVMLNPDGSVDPGFVIPSPQPDSNPGFLTIQPDGKVVVTGHYRVNNLPYYRLFRLQNYPATESLTVLSPKRVQWLRGGSSPESHQVTLDVSTNGGTTWTPLAGGFRISGGWEWSGLTLPPGGQLRALARLANNSASGLVGKVMTYALRPEIETFDGVSTGGTAVTDGQAAPIQFGETRQGTPVDKPFTIRNTGNGDLHLNSVTLPAGYRAQNLPAFPAIIEPGGTLTFQIALEASASGVFNGIVTINTDDSDEAVFDFPVNGTVVSPEIIVHDGNGTAPELSDGQEAAVDFEVIRQGSPQARMFTISNTGTAPLLINQVTAPTGFSVLDLPPLPATVAVAQTLAFRIQMDATALGTFAGRVSITSDDVDEAVFDFPVTGMVVSPEIAVHEGNAAGPELSDGQAAPVNFGRNVQGTPATRSFTIANTGTAPLLVGSITLPPGYTALNAPALALTVGIGQSVTFQISLTTLTIGTHPGSVVIASDDLDEASFDFPVTGEVFIPDPVATPPANAAAGLNRQTGLREQTIHITNDTTATVPAYNIIVRGLPAGVEVNNASSQREDGSWVIYVRRPMDPHAAQDILLEYFSATRLPAEFMPQLSTEVVLVPPDLSVPGDAATFRIDVVKAVPGGVLIEFPTTPGRRYQVQYSADGTNWQSSLPSINAVANRTQWVDRGLPRTDSAPATVTSRFYRVGLLP